MSEEYYYYIVFSALDRKNKAVTGSAYFDINRPIEFFEDYLEIQEFLCKQYNCKSAIITNVMSCKGEKRVNDE